MLTARPLFFGAPSGASQCRACVLPLSLQTFLDAKEVTERVISVVRNFEKVDPAKVTWQRARRHLSCVRLGADGVCLVGRALRVRRCR